MVLKRGGDRHGAPWCIVEMINDNAVLVEAVLVSTAAVAVEVAGVGGAGVGGT